MTDQTNRRLHVLRSHISPSKEYLQNDQLQQNSTGVITALMLTVPTLSAVAFGSAYAWTRSPSRTSIRYKRPIELNDVIKAYVRLVTKFPQKTATEEIITNLPKIEIRAPIRPDHEHLEHYISQLSAREDLQNDEILPPFYLAALTGSLNVLVMAHPMFPIRVLGAVNSSNQIKIVTPVKREWLENGELSAVCRLGEGRLVKRGIEFDTITEVYRGDILVWSLVFRSIQFIPGVKNANNKQRESNQVDETEITSYQINLPKDAGRVYGKMGYDINPIHMSDAGARMFGFPQVMAHGMWVMAQAEAKAKRNEFIDRDKPQVIDVTFKKPTLLPATVNVTIYKQGDGKHFVMEREGTKKMIVIEGHVNPL